MPVTIREQSEQMKAGAAEHLPAEVVEVFDRSIQFLLDEGVPDGVVAVGDTLGSFTLNDATGTSVTLNQLVEGGPAVIVFYRGGWCPYCNLALRTYQQELLPNLLAFDARLVAISPQSPDQSLSTAEKPDSTSRCCPTRPIVWPTRWGSSSSKPTRSSTLNASWALTWPK
jgi:AhpC/TSA family